MGRNVGSGWRGWLVCGGIGGGFVVRRFGWF